MSSALPRPTVGRAAGVVLALVALTGCGAGFEAQTYQERSSADSVNAAVGSIAVRNLSVLPEGDGVLEAGDDAEVILTLVNVGGDDDRLPVLYPTGVTAADLAADLPKLAA